MKIIFLVLFLVVMGCSPEAQRQFLQGLQAGAMVNNPQQYQQSNYNPQYYNPDMDCQTYPAGYPFKVTGGMVTSPNPDGSVTVCRQRGGNIYNTRGQQVGTYEPY
jgi:hypothetical protein